MACSSCNNRPSTPSTQSLVSSKLGKCMACIVASFIGTILCWVLIFIVYTYKPILPLQIMAVIFVTAFTSLFLAHSLRFLFFRITNRPD